MRCYKVRDQSAINFITFSGIEWVDVFTRRQYANIEGLIKIEFLE